MPRQFDIVENQNPAARRQYPFLVVLQHDRVAALESAVVAPLAQSSSRLAGSRLHPSVMIGGRPHVIVVEQLAAVQPNLLGRVVALAAACRYEIVAALDLLFTGI